MKDFTKALDDIFNSGNMNPSIYDAELAKKKIKQAVDKYIIEKNVVYEPGNPFTLTIAKRSRDSIEDENDFREKQRRKLWGDI